MYPLRQITGLCVLGWGRDKTNFFGFYQFIEQFGRKLIGEEFEIAVDKFSGLMALFLPGRKLSVKHVIIPIEKSLTRILQLLEEVSFHLVQYVEADKYIAVIFQ